MSAQKTSWGWLSWVMVVLVLAMILGSFYYGGSAVGLPMAVGAVVGGVASWGRRARA